MNFAIAGSFALLVLSCCILPGSSRGASRTRYHQRARRTDSRPSCRPAASLSLCTRRMRIPWRWLEAMAWEKGPFS